MLNAQSWAYFAFLFMPTAGYSGTPLLQKLGIKPGHKLLVINEPDNYSRLIQADISNQLCDKNATPRCRSSVC